jgi:hypothetical protein
VQYAIRDSSRKRSSNPKPVKGILDRRKDQNSSTLHDLKSFPTESYPKINEAAHIVSEGMTVSSMETLDSSDPKSTKRVTNSDTSNSSFPSSTSLDVKNGKRSHRTMQQSVDMKRKATTDLTCCYEHVDHDNSLSPDQESFNAFMRSVDDTLHFMMRNDGGYMSHLLTSSMIGSDSDSDTRHSPFLDEIENFIDPFGVGDDEAVIESSCSSPYSDISDIFYY